ncbi:hypothetical protein [Thermanaerovibrio acidaminovorans]|uniref:Uncharacterized protein n=1 Tax=Thermanaerovibrio acidaminovorans (strain ATCC 49978 / DSM 6589 / Su883) TaxID=525903 RepID=D1B8L9_THEAS|nr:hypothetical protein [Thermanaerovibrio acidaminovorans]ACZ18622.1 hypothetical protein Taci_0385 [Thermanaerovibrio acidaminovorans DSM 6589]
MGFGVSEERELTRAREALLESSRGADRWVREHRLGIWLSALALGAGVGFLGPRRAMGIARGLISLLVLPGRGPGEGVPSPK